MFSRIYKLQFYKQPDVPKDEDDDFSHPIYKELSQCINIEDERFINFDEKDDMYLNLPEHKVLEISDILKKYGAVLDIIDITEEVILGFFEKKITNKNNFTNPNFFEKFRLINEDIDMVLDKINKYGIESLDDIDRKILKSV